MPNKSITLPPAGSSAVGIYEAQVVESTSLPRLRRKAFKIAGLFGEYDGSVAAYHALDDYAKEAHDKELSRLVVRNAKLLKSQRRLASLVSTTGKRNNLILDQALNKLLQASSPINWATFAARCAAGTGTTATFTDSGATTATTAGSSTTVTASGSIFVAAHVGQLLRFDSGEERYIASQTGTECVVTVAVNIAAPTLFTVWAVNQTGLASELARTGTYLTGTGNTGRSQASNVFTYKWTYDFAAEVGNVNYTELGWSESASVAANLNSRTLIAGGTVSVLIGQQLRVIYSLAVTISPAVTTPGTYSITGWPVAPAATVDGDYIFANPVSGVVPGLNTSGGPSPGTFPGQRDSSGSGMILGTGSTLPTFGNSYSGGTTANSTSQTYLAYTSQSFFLDAESAFNLTTGNGTTWRGICNVSGNGLVFVFDEAQTKANTHTLTLRMRMTVGRTLTNP